MNRPREVLRVMMVRQLNDVNGSSEGIVQETINYQAGIHSDNERFVGYFRARLLLPPDTLKECVTKDTVGFGRPVQTAYPLVPRNGVGHSGR